MKQSIVKIFTFSLLVYSISFISCVDNEKNLFNADQLKQIYEETFPVKNIDSDGDWTMSRSVTAHVSINGDQGVDYKIQIFDADPLSPESTAKLLAEGTVTQSMTLDVVMDCATSLDKVFVARIDEHKRYLVQPTAIENGTVTAHFGDKGTPTRSISRAVTTSIPVMEAPYTADFLVLKRQFLLSFRLIGIFLQSLAGVEVMVNFLFLQKVSVGLRFRKELLKLDLVQLEIEMEK